MAVNKQNSEYEARIENLKQQFQSDLEMSMSQASVYGTPTKQERSGQFLENRQSVDMQSLDVSQFSVTSSNYNYTNDEIRL